MPALTAYRQTLAKELGFFLAGTAATGSTTAALIDTAFPIKSALDQGDLYAGKYLLRPAAADPGDRVRLVADDGYDPATGTLAVDLAWTTAPAAGEAYELHGLIEPWGAMNELLDAALKRCLLVVEVAVTATADNQRHGLAVAAPWLQDPRWVRQGGYVLASENRNRTDPYRRALRGSVERDGAALYVNHPGQTFATDTTLYFRCLKRSYDHCRTSAVGTWGERSGLAAEAHEAPVAEEWVAAAAQVEFWERFGDVVAGGNRGDAEANQRKAAARFTELTSAHLTVPPVTILPPLRAWGPRRWW